MPEAMVCDEDFYSDAFIRDPLPRYAAMRALGPVVWMTAQNAYAATHYDTVVEVLRRDGDFISGKGISLSEDVNAMLIGSTVNSDGEAHDRRRALTASALMPRTIKPLEDYVHATAQGMADRLVAQGMFDGVTEFAQVLPLSVVIDLVGLSDEGRDNMLDWGAAVFDLMDGLNLRSQEAFGKLVGLRRYLDEHGHRDALKDGGLARRIFDLAPESGFSEAEAAQLMRDYISPSLDTTISAAGFIPWLFARNPDQWDMLRADPDLIPNAVEEVVRLASPIRSFSRYVARDTDLGGYDLPEGARIMVLYGSANRDDLFWEDPDRFDITRNTRKHVGFGHGAHLCMGLHLARRELVNLIEAMRTRVARWEIVGEPEIAMNNTIRAFASLPVRVVAG
jgi:cytochrome P450